MPENVDEKKIGEDLVREGLMSANQLRTSLEYQASLGGRLTEIILKLGFVSDKAMNGFVARHEHMNAIDLTGKVVDKELMARIPRKVIERHEAIPLRASDETILLAMNESSDFQAIEDFQFLTSCRIETVLAPRSQILEMIARYYSEQEQLAAVTELPLAEQLAHQVADPAVAALARALLQKGVITAEEWRDKLNDKRTEP